MRVCGIVGSPNKNGNVDLLVSQVLKGASSQGAEIQKFYLNEMNIQPCQDCGVDPYPNYCLFDDDMAPIYAVLESWDVIVLGSPVYFDTVSAQTKLAIDRCNCLAPFIRRHDGTWGIERRIEKRKKGVFIAVAGEDQEFDTILVTVNGFFDWANIELTGTILYANPGNELGNVKNEKEKMAQAFEIGLEIVKESNEFSKGAD